MECILQIWQKRGLSLLGKILIVNSLVGSLFTYRLSVLPKIPSSYIDRFNKLVKDFIWNGRKAKIALRTLQGEKENGGLGLVNLRTKDIALKLQWIPKIYKNQAGSEKEIIYYNMGNPIGDAIWEASIREKDIRNKGGDPFWKDVLVYWTLVNGNEPTNKVEILNQVIWQNSAIRIQDKIIAWPKWIQVGIMTIRNLVNENGYLKEIEEIRREFNIEIPFLNRLSLWEAIPKVWKKKLKENEEPRAEPTMFERIRKMSKPVRMLYKIVNEDQFLLGNLVKRWSEKGTLDIDLDELIRAMRATTQITIYVKLRSFQVRVLCRAVITNVHLRKYGIRDNDNCTFCNSQAETMEHLFLSCPRVKGLWDYVKEITGNDENIDFKMIVLNTLHTKPKQIDNLILLLMKFYIYKTRCANERIKKQSLENFIKTIHDIEQNIAKEKNKLQLHESKWNQIKFRKVE